MQIHCDYKKMVPLADLKPNPKNRNEHPQEQIDRLAKIFQYQGIRHPIIVSERSGFIVAGHGRLAAAQKLGLDSFPVDYQDFADDEQEYAFLISDNAIASWAELDLSGINADLGDLGPDLDLDLLGIRGFKLDLSETAANGDPEAIPEKPEPRTKLGNIFRLGDHRLMCGDSTKLEEVGRLMGETLADIVWTDPPYNVDYEGRTKEKMKIGNDNMGDSDFRTFLRSAFSNMARVSKAGAGIYVAHADLEGVNFRSALVEGGFLLKQVLIWAKQQFVMGRQDYHWQHEPILYGWKEGAAHYWAGDRKQSTLLNFDRPSRSSDHPTTKPIPLIEYCLRNSSDIGHIVLDLFGGSGSTMIAAERTGRRARLMEISPEYCDVIVARWELFTGKKAELVE